jgi:hypothetical protein
MSYEPMKLVTLEEKPGDWVAYVYPSRFVQVGLGNTREKALEDLALCLGLKLDIVISLHEGVEGEE